MPIVIQPSSAITTGVASASIGRNSLRSRIEGSMGAVIMS